MPRVNLVLHPAGQTRLGDFLIAQLSNDQWTEFRAAVAFVKQSGVRHIYDGLNRFSQRALVKMSVGIDRGGTSREGVGMLSNCINPRGQLWIFHNENGSTFHPKVYLFKNETHADVLVGSGNLTGGGLFTNYEASVLVSLDLANEPDQSFLQGIEAQLDVWCNPDAGTAKLLTPDIFQQLVDFDDLPTEAQLRETEDMVRRRQQTQRPGAGRQPLFARVAVPAAPPTRTAAIPHTRQAGARGARRIAVGTTPTVFLMTLQRTDVGIGQTHPGAARRSPEIFIPLIARDYASEFWGWPQHFRRDIEKPGKMDRRGVRIRIGTEIVEINMMTWPDKKDFRLRSEKLRSAGNVGDILRLEKTDGQDGFKYYAEVIPSGTILHTTYLERCAQPTRNSRKMWGYY